MPEKPLIDKIAREHPDWLAEPEPVEKIRVPWWVEAVALGVVALAVLVVSLLVF